MKLIKLTQDKEAIVDDEDYEYLSQFKWFYHNRGYAARNSPWKNRKRTLILMHRILFNEPKKSIDHINGNKLDNRKFNLRVCDNKYNVRNQKAHEDKITSLYKGVNKHSKTRWQARICVDRKQIYLGLFENEIEAAKAYNEAAIKYHGEFAKLNEIKNKV